MSKVKLACLLFALWMGFCILSITKIQHDNVKNHFSSVSTSQTIII